MNHFSIRSNKPSVHVKPTYFPWPLMNGVPKVLEILFYLTFLMDSH